MTGAAEQAMILAVVGHVNKGKSTLLATLSANDAIRISPWPGTTKTCEAFDLECDGRTVMTFLDTPGFQNARAAWDRIQEYKDNGLTEQQSVFRFSDRATNEPEFKDETELMKAIRDGSGILYIVDGSRPYNESYRAEMEILRWAGKPSMAVINPIHNTAGTAEAIDSWKQPLHLYFKKVVEFDAAGATPVLRFDLLRELLTICPEWKKHRELITHMERQWVSLSDSAAGYIRDYLRDVLTLSISESASTQQEAETLKPGLRDTYQKKIEKRERILRENLRKLYHHERLIDQTDAIDPDEADWGSVFDEKAWSLFGLTRKQAILAGAAAGGGTGAVLDLMLGGLTFGVFTGIGSVIGAGTAWLGGDRLAEIRIRNPIFGKDDIQLGRYLVTIGPHKNPNFPWVLLNRALCYYSLLSNRVHGNRDAFHRDSEQIEGQDDQVQSELAEAMRIVTARRPEKSSKKYARLFAAVSEKRFRQEQYEKLFELVKQETRILAGLEAYPD